MHVLRQGNRRKSEIITAVNISGIIKLPPKSLSGRRTRLDTAKFGLCTDYQILYHVQPGFVPQRHLYMLMEYTGMLKSTKPIW